MPIRVAYYLSAIFDGASRFGQRATIVDLTMIISDRMVGSSAVDVEPPVALVEVIQNLYLILLPIWGAPWAERTALAPKSY